VPPNATGPRSEPEAASADRVRNRDDKCEGRKSHAEARPEVVDLAKRLHKQGMTYRAIGAELEKADHVNERGRPFHHKSIRAMLE
jgi:hypothetical protein